MRLLQIDEHDKLSLTKDLYDNIPPYAILSHTWGSDEDELTLADVQNGEGTNKFGYLKTQFCGQQARRDGLHYFWVDTCCIDKSSAAELSEALNSMFKWYQKAEKCYVYLSDVSLRKRDAAGQTDRTWQDAFRSSRWFTRGWTLQELLAPKSVEFFSREQDVLGTRSTLERIIQETTQIPALALQGASLSGFDVKERMRWAANRRTKRPEDKAYSLLGILGVFMAPIYGEEEYAFSRLEEKVAERYRQGLNLAAQLSLSVNNDVVVDAAQPLPLTPREAAMASLSFEQMDSRHSNIKNALASTCTWILEHPTYQAWLDASSAEGLSRFLWLNGKPGAGKSTVMKFILDRTRKHAVEGDIVLSFFFNARGEDLEKSTCGMYRSLLFQLFTAVPELQDILDEGDLTFSSKSAEHLAGVFSRAVERLENINLTCLIDALDECDEEEIRQMVEQFEELAEQASSGQKCLQICFASRHYPTIDIRNGWQLILENESGHMQDLSKYIKKHLRAGKGKYIEEIRELVLEKANGVFMWAVLVVEVLNKEFQSGRIFAVKKRLAELPPKLSDLFRDIIHRDPTNLDDLRLCIQWILFAKRPLSPEEFYFAMVAGLNDEQDAIAPWDREQTSREDMIRYLLNSSKGLAELTRSQKKPTVQFIHESVRDFLLKDGGLRNLWPDLQGDICAQSNDDLKRYCTNYLSIDLGAYVQDMSSLPKASSVGMMKLLTPVQADFPFLVYAVDYVLLHAEDAASAIPQHEFLQTFPRRTYIELYNFLEHRQNRRYTSQASMPYISAEQNTPRLIRTLRTLGAQLHRCEKERYSYPLLAAVAVAAEQALAAILDHDCAVSLAGIGRGLSCKSKQNPFLWALDSRQDSIATAILLSSECRSAYGLNLSDESIVDAAIRHNCKQVALLMFRKLSENSDTSCTSWPHWLSKACGDGHYELVELVLRQKPKGAHNCPLEFLLDTAARCKRWDIVCLLLNYGIKLNEVDIPGSTALHYALMDESSLEYAKVLIKRGVDLEGLDRNRNSPVNVAIQNRNILGLELLLNSGADVEKAPLHWAKSLTFLWWQNKGPWQVEYLDVFQSLLSLLMNNGADINARNRAGQSPLMVVVCQLGYTPPPALIRGMIDLLVRSGSEIDARDRAGETALILAVRGRNVEIVERLLYYGADPLRTDNHYLSAADVAEEQVKHLGGHPVLQEEANRILDIFKKHQISLDGRCKSPRIASDLHSALDTSRC